MATATKNFKRFFSQYKILTLLFAIVVIWAFFGQLTEGAFLTPRNFSNLLRQMAITGMLASGMVFVIISGEIDRTAIYGVFNCLLEQLLVPVDMGREELAGRDFGFADDAFDQLHTSCTVAKVDIDHSRFPGKNTAKSCICNNTCKFLKGWL